MDVRLLNHTPEGEIGMRLADEEDREEIDTLGGLVFMLAGRGGENDLA